VSLPNSVTTIGQLAFRGCSGLTSITLPNSLDSISYGTFSRCSGLTSISIPSSVTSIGNSAFYNCSGLTTISIPEGVGSIGGWAFCGCSGLTDVTIASSVTSIGDSAFAGGDHIIQMTCNAAVPPTVANVNAFDDVFRGIPLYVPAASLSSYRVAYGWREFTNFIGMSTYTITATGNNPAWGTVSGGGSYGDGATATLTAMPNAGYHFVRWQDGNTQNPRTITVTGDATYTAYFEADASEDDCPAVSSFPWNATFDEELTCWKTVDADGDGYSWRNYEDYVVSESYSYFDGTNRGLTPDNWLISRRIQIPASGSYALSWTAGGLSEEYYNENYSVYVSTTGDNPSDFTTQLFSETLNTPDAVNRSKSLDNWRGQTVRIAFRHHNTNDVFVLGVANVKIGQGSQGVENVDESGVAVYATDDRIHVEGAAGESIKVFSIDGRVVASVASAGLQTTIAVENAGVYVVRVGEGAARKVVVIR